VAIIATALDNTDPYEVIPDAVNQHSKSVIPVFTKELIQTKMPK